MAVTRQRHVYKQTPQGDMHIDYYTADDPTGPSDAAALMLPGGGWKQVNIDAFRAQCHYLAGRGVAAFCAEYRCMETHGVSAADAMEDGFDALRWVRDRAGELGFRPDRILMGGGSAGGGTSLSAAAQAVRRDDPRMAPNAVVGFNPPGQLLEPTERAERFAGKAAEYCPTAHADAIGVPVLIFHGDADQIVPLDDVTGLQRAIREAGGRCELVVYPGVGHSFFHDSNHGGAAFVDTMRRLDRWLVELGWLEPWSKMHATK